MENENLERQSENIYYKHNPWISILRIYMCFVVIRNHFLPVGDTILQKVVAQFSGIAVLCFMFISFFFMGDDIKMLRIDRIRNRILRLYIPIFVWNIAYWICKNLSFWVFGERDHIIGINGLIEGLLFTHYEGLATQLWFLFAQIIILIMVSVFLSYINSDRIKNISLILITVGAIITEYLGVNNELFGSSSYAVRYPLGRIIECIPIAMFGLLYAWELKYKNALSKVLLLCICITVAAISFFYIPMPSGFGYGGLYLLFSSTAICILFFILPDFIQGRLRIVINYIGSCTMGIYCSHMLIGWMIQVASSKIDVLARITHKDTLIFDTIIFMACFVTTCIIRWINHKLHWKWLEYIA